MEVDLQSATNTVLRCYNVPPPNPPNSNRFKCRSVAACLMPGFLEENKLLLDITSFISSSTLNFFSLSAFVRSKQNTKNKTKT